MSEHTPGPWKADRVLIGNAEDRMMVHIDAWGGENIADCGTFAECDPADARLIAAAPDMYEALRDLRVCYMSISKRATLDAALAKAEGRG